MTTYILPGMGADSSMYGSAFRKLDGVKYLDWPLYKNEQSISEIAARIITENNIQSSDIVGGSSLGGIVAAEIAQQMEVEKLILIGSTLTPDTINLILKKFHKLSAITPVNLIQTFAGKACKIFCRSGSCYLEPEGSPYILTKILLAVCFSLLLLSMMGLGLHYCIMTEKIRK